MRSISNEQQQQQHRTHERKTLKSKHNFACFHFFGGFAITERVILHIFPCHKTLSQEPMLAKTKITENDLKLIFLSICFFGRWMSLNVLKLNRVLMNFFAIFHSGKVGSANKLNENYTMKMMRMLQFIHLFSPDSSLFAQKQ